MSQGYWELKCVHLGLLCLMPHRQSGRSQNHVCLIKSLMDQLACCSVVHNQLQFVQSESANGEKMRRTSRDIWGTQCLIQRDLRSFWKVKRLRPAVIRDVGRICRCHLLHSPQLLTVILVYSLHWEGQLQIRYRGHFVKLQPVMVLNGQSQMEESCHRMPVSELRATVGNANRTVRLIRRRLGSGATTPR